MGRVRSIVAAAGVVGVLVLAASCGSSSSSGSNSSSDSSAARSTTTAPATERDLRKALLDQSDVGPGYTKIDEASGSQQTSDNSPTDLSKLNATPECKILLELLSNQAKSSDKKTARVLFRKDDKTPLIESLLTINGLEARFTQQKQAIGSCGQVGSSGTAGSVTVSIAPFEVPKLGDDSFGGKFTVTLMAQGQTVTENSYFGLVRRGEVAEQITVSDHVSTTEPPATADPNTVAGFLQKADAKLAKQS